MDKYKNKNGTMLSFTSNDLHTQLVKEVVQEAIKILGTVNCTSVSLITIISYFPPKYPAVKPNPTPSTKANITAEKPTIKDILDP